jgi:hypothetical protein
VPARLRQCLPCLSFIFASCAMIFAKFPSFRGVAAKLTGCSRQRRPPLYLRVFANLVALNTPRQARKGLDTPLREGNFLQSAAKRGNHPRKRGNHPRKMGEFRCKWGKNPRKTWQPPPQNVATIPARQGNHPRKTGQTTWRKGQTRRSAPTKTAEMPEIRPKSLKIP